MSLKDKIVENPVIAAIRNDEELEKVLYSDVSIVFILYGTITNVSDICSKLKSKGKIIFVHIDFIDGIKSNAASIKFLKDSLPVDGIITTKASSIKYIKQNGLYAIQRIFLIDTLSVETGIKSVHETKPDAIEIMPGIVSEAIKDIKNNVRIPIIAGGLVKTKKDVINALSSGAVAVSTSKSELWDL